MKTLKVLTTAAIATAVLSTGAISASAAMDQPTKGDVTFTADSDAIELTSAPNISFGSHTVTENADENTGAPFKLLGANSDKQVVVTDNRGVGTGWTLQASLSGPFHTLGGLTLEGAKLSFNNMVYSSSLTGVTSISSIINSPTEIGTTAVNIMVASGTATDPDGMGVNTGSFSNTESTDPTNGTVNDSITLSIPEASARIAEQYSTDLNWKLLITP